MNSPSSGPIVEISALPSSLEEKLQGTPFVTNTYQLLNDPANLTSVTWSEAKDSFVIVNVMDFTNQVLPKYFKHNNFNSFLRQLNAYGFHKTDSKQWEFKHPSFKSGHPELLKTILRKKSKKQGERDYDHHNSSSSGNDNHLEPKRDHMQIPQTPSLFSPYNSSLNATVSTLQLLQAQQRESHTPSQQSSSDVPPFFELSHMLHKEGNPVPKSSLQQQQGELDRLKEMNSLIITSIGNLQQQQKKTQDDVRQILEELVRSRVEQQNLQRVLEDVVLKRKQPPSPESSHHLQKMARSMQTSMQIPIHPDQLRIEEESSQMLTQLQLASKQ